MMWFWKDFLFLVCLPLMLLAVLLDVFHTTVMQIGGGAPRMQSLAKIRHHWKDLWRIQPIKNELDVVGGYMYFKVTYSDGSQLLHREL